METHNLQITSLDNFVLEILDQLHTGKAIVTLEYV
jgi:hypothetical protein